MRLFHPLSTSKLYSIGANQTNNLIRIRGSFGKDDFVTKNSGRKVVSMRQMGYLDNAHSSVFKSKGVQINNGKRKEIIVLLSFILVPDLKFSSPVLMDA